LQVVATVPLATALDNPNLVWVTDATTPWFGQTNVFHSNGSSAQSFFIGDNSHARLVTGVTGPGTLSFWWKVSSQTNADVLSLSVNGSMQSQISGEVDWQARQVYLGAGSNDIEWTYAKDAGGSAGQDAGWVDLVQFVAGGVPPSLVAQPSNEIVFYGTPASVSVGAQGTPPLQYQWSFDGTAIAGATNSVYTIAAATPDQAGTYSVQVSNDYGVTNSVGTVVAIVPVMAVGNNDFQQATVSSAAANAIAIAAGDFHSLVLSADGQVAAWGDDFNAQCDVPAGLGGVVGIAAGGYHSLALKRDGTVVGWGANDAGQLTVPTSATNLIAIAAGESHSVGLRVDGQVFAWGDNSSGQINIPAMATNVVAIAAGGNHSVALRADGVALAWGDNLDAYGMFVGEATIPWWVSNVVAVAAGQYHTLAVKQDGSVVAWGDNSAGQSQPPMLTNAVVVAGGTLFSVALKADGTLAGWGNDWSGQYSYPANLNGVQAVAAGSSHSLVLVGAASSAPTLLYPTWNGAQFSLLVQSIAGKNYTLEFKTALTDPTWNPVRTLYGNGMPQFLVDLSANATQRYYRVRQW
jgi:hypothetical protein